MVVTILCFVETFGKVEVGLCGLEIFCPFFLGCFQTEDKFYV